MFGVLAVISEFSSRDEQAFPIQTLSSRKSTIKIITTTVIILIIILTNTAE
jgi:hypothetical protein